MASESAPRTSHFLNERQTFGGHHVHLQHGEPRLPGKDRAHGQAPCLESERMGLKCPRCQGFARLVFDGWEGGEPIPGFLSLIMALLGSLPAPMRISCSEFRGIYGYLTKLSTRVNKATEFWQLVQKGEFLKDTTRPLRRPS